MAPRFATLTENTTTQLTRHKTHTNTYAYRNTISDTIIH